MTNTADIYPLIDSPPITPRPYGLFSVAPPTNGSERWSFGVSFKPSVGCLTADTWQDACIQGGPGGDKVLTPFECDPITASPFMVYVLSQSGGIDQSLAGAQASGALEAAEEHAVEDHLWYEMSAAATDLGPAVDGRTALAVLEANLAVGYRGQGVIHLTPYGATMMVDYLVATPSGLVTKACGTPVVVGSGYGDRSSPTLEAIATGGLFIRRGEVSELSAWDREVNDVYALAEREYLVAWDCIALKVSVALAP